MWLTGDRQPRFLHPAAPNPSFFRPCRTVRRLHGCKCFALVLFVPVAGDAPAASGAGPPSEGRDWRGQNDGGKNASINNQRTDAPDADRTLRPCGAHHIRPCEFSGRLNRTPQRANQPAQYPQCLGASRLLALMRSAHDGRSKAIYHAPNGCRGTTTSICCGRAHSIKSARQATAYRVTPRLRRLGTDNRQRTLPPRR